MAINKKLIHFKNKTDFQTQYNAGNLLNTSIIFIQDAKQIWTHGQFYSCPFTEEEIKQLFTGANIKLDDYIEIESPIDIKATDTVNEAFGKIEDYLDSLLDLNAVLVDTGDVASDPAINDYISPSELSLTLTNYATKSQLNIKDTGAKSYTDQVITNLIGTAPDTMDTLGELATVIQGNKDVIDLLETSITNKVDKISGKSLSTNDYTTAEKNKLAGIAAGAQVNTITGVKGDAETTYRTGNVNINKTNIGLGNVDNTADANKSVKYATSSGSCTGNAATATKATQDGSGNTITSTYATKSEMNTGLNGKITANGTVTAVVALTQAQYNALGSNISPTTLYIITD